MCITLDEAELTNTLIYVGEANHPKEGAIHVLGYQNKVQNKANSPNAMILHIPSKTKLTENNVLDMSQAKNVLRDMAESVKPRTKSIEPEAGEDSLKEEAMIFDHDIYTVVVGSAKSIPNTLPKVPQEKRPNLNKKLFDWYAEKFPDWQVAVCCFNNKDAEEASPLFWWYQPLDPATLHAPALDAHDGNPPQLDQEVEVDHWIIAGSQKNKEPNNANKKIFYTENISEEIKLFLPTHALGKKFSGKLPNGDFAIKVADILTGKQAFVRG